MSRFTTTIPATGPAGNVFAIIGTACALMRQLRVPNDEIAAFSERAMATESYADALAVVREWFPVDTGEDEDSHPS